MLSASTLRRDPGAGFREFRTRYSLPRPAPLPPRTSTRGSHSIPLAHLGIAATLVGCLVYGNTQRNPASLPSSDPPRSPMAAPSAESTNPVPKLITVKPDPVALSPPPLTHIDFPWLTRLSNGEPVTWPCGPIGYRVALENAPEGANELAAEATARISVASGYQFRGDPPLRRIAEHEAPYGGITIAWLPRTQFPDRDPRTIGYGGANWIGTKYANGYVDVLAEWPGAHQVDFSARGVGRLLLHELGHALGLDHIDDPRAVMYHVNQGVSEWSPAEQEALQYLKQECG